MARVGLVIDIRTLAKAAQVSTRTLVRLERDKPLRPATMARIRTTLESMGAEFSDDGVGVRVQPRTPPKPRPRRKKAKR